MTGIKIEDVAYVRFRAPDLDLMKAYLADFGLVVTEERPDQIFARGTGPAPFVHGTERGEPGLPRSACKPPKCPPLKSSPRLRAVPSHLWMRQAAGMS